MNDNEFPIHQALIKPVVLLGAPRMITILNIIFGINMVMTFHAWWVILFSIVAQGIGAFMAKDDPEFMEVLIRHLKHQDYYGV